MTKEVHPQAEADVGVLLAQADPIAQDWAHADDEATDAALERFWRIADQEPSPVERRSRPTSAGSKRRWALGVACALVLAGSAAAVVGTRVLPDDPIGSQAMNIDASRGAFMGELNGYQYFRAPSGDGACLVQVASADQTITGRTCTDEAAFVAGGGMVNSYATSPGGRPIYVAGLLPSGITTVNVSGSEVAVTDGFFLAETGQGAPTAVYANGPAAGDVVADMDPALLERETGTGAYRVLVTPPGMPSQAP